MFESLVIAVIGGEIFFCQFKVTRYYTCLLYTSTEAEIKEFFLSHMARHKCPRYIDFVDDFPMNAAGKILKYKMREDAVKKYGLENAAAVKTA